MEWIYAHDLQYIFRLILACLCGTLIGMERKSRSKEAGLRTHCLVACASALMMIISKYAYADMEGVLSGMTKLDPSRVASGVASGVGFLGAGMIFVRKNMVTGLTTAAGIWATAGIGLAIGAGMYTVGIVASGIILLVQLLLHANTRWLAHPKQKQLILKSKIGSDVYEYAHKVFAEKNITVNDISINKNIIENWEEYIFSIEMAKSLSEKEILDCFECDCNVINGD